MDFTHEQLPARVVFGAGRRHDAPAELDALGTTSLLVIGGSHDVDTVSDLVDDVAVPAETIIGVRPHVPSATVDDALQLVDRYGPSTVVTIGGGSATGLGKMIALARDIDLVAIPTTYAGSEMTPIWGTTEDGEKRTGRSPRVLPRVVIYDPELTFGLPGAVTVNSAFNALAHCVEALWLPETSPITADAATAAIRSILASLVDVVDRPEDVDARSRLLYGAHRSGSVLAEAGTGLLHTTAHVLGGMFDLDHGAIYTVLTPRMVGHQITANERARELLVDALGPDPQRRLEDLAARLGAPRSLAEIGFPEDATRVVADTVARRTGVSADRLEPLLSAAATGRRPHDPS